MMRGIETATLYWRRGDSTPLNTTGLKEENTPELRRALGLAAITIFGVGDILGAGVYGLMGRIAGLTGTAAWISCVLAGITAAFTGLTYAELTARFPRAGGAAHFCHVVHRIPLITFLVTFCVGLSGVFSTATGARIIGNYALALFPGTPPAFKEYLMPILFVLLLGFIAARGIVFSSAANTVCTMIEGTGLCIIILVGLPFLGTADYLDYASALPEHAPTPAVLLALSGASLVFYAFIGFEDLANLSEEVRHPERNIPLAICFAITITTVIYCIIALVAVSVIPPRALAASSSPLLDVVRQAAPGFPLWVFSIIPAVAAFNTALMNLLMTSRLLYGMSRQQIPLLPPALAYIHPVWRTPIVSVLVSTGVIIVLIVSFRDIKTLASGASTFLLTVFILLHFALIRVKRNPSFPPAPFAIPGLVPLLGVATCFGLLFRQDITALKTASLLACLAIGVFWAHAVLRCAGKSSS